MSACRRRCLASSALTSRTCSTGQTISCGGRHQGKFDDRRFNLAGQRPESSSYHKVQAPLVLHSFTHNATEICVCWLQVCPSQSSALRIEAQFEHVFRCCCCNGLHNSVWPVLRAGPDAGCSSAGQQVSHHVLVLQHSCDTGCKERELAAGGRFTACCTCKP